MFATWWQGWSNRHGNGSSPGPGRHNRARFQPGLEMLEDRLVPAAPPPMTYVVTTTADVVNGSDARLSLREAISLANGNSGPDTIILRAGIYKITIPPGPGPVNDTGAFDILDSVTLKGAGAVSTIITARQLDRVFAVGRTGSPIEVTFQGLTIRGGKNGPGAGILMGDADLTLRGCVVTANAGTGDGAGISNALNPGTGDLTLIRSLVKGNHTTGSGGGIYLEGSAVTLLHSSVNGNIAGTYGGGISTFTVTMTNSAVRGNHASDESGGIYTTTATLTNSTLSGNHAAGDGGGLTAGTVTLTSSTVRGNSAGGSGGGLFATTATLTNSTVRGNSAESGGGLVALGGTATLTNSIVRGNTSGSNGGGIVATTATLTNSTVHGNIADESGGGIFANTATLTNCTVTGNTAGTTGGGMNAGTATLINSTFSGNHAGASGGGLIAGTATLLNVTITKNTALISGGGIFRHPLASGSFNITSTIIARNRVAPTGDGPDVFGTFTSQGHNLIGINAGAEASFPAGNPRAKGDRVGTADAPINPRLGLLANNGGRTKTHALLQGSPAVNRGDNLASSLLTTDQRDGKFKRQVGPFVDIGAFERQ